jgi:hypothetical protein
MEANVVEERDLQSEYEDWVKIILGPRRERGDMTATAPTSQKTSAKTAAAPTNCPGSGKTWESGGKCPECGISADQIAELGIQSRRPDDSLAPRVPMHPIPGGPVVNRKPDRKPVRFRPTDKSKPVGEAARPAPAQKGAATKAALKAAAGPRMAPLKTDTPNGKPPAKPAPPKPKVAATTDPLTKPFTKTIEAYLIWLEKQTGPFAKLDPHRLAGLAISMYGKYQISDERKAARAALGS